ncbi:PGF-CTERM sorting domain-containing protein [Natronorubrum thiooxidans]|uniref:PGF-CTERM protein/surface glycoprotein n=1 Tax=Natronorubrum thiooxidans TaxID=308853 RepID=A0A1N7FSS4_9EURY|nr:PGF-CTERM sorting domain-containing protein [Natronorubrum thiooxidans]SIS03295.1 PGF-CTERM protein/surface glycoprotein [Natronorubrum thiooxidans]
MTSKTTTLQKGRAVLLAGLMVLSVVAMSAAFAGAAAANHADEDVTFTDQALGIYDGDTAFVVESVDAHEGQYLEIKNENTGDVVYETEISEDLTNAAIYVPSEKAGQYTATVYADDTREDAKASDTAMVYGAGIQMSDQSADSSIDQVSVDVAALLDGHDDDTEFGVVLTDEDGNELGEATGLTGVNEDLVIETSTIETETVVTATVYLDGEPIQAYSDEAESFVTIADSATVTPGMDDGDDNGDDNGDDADDKDDDKEGDEKDHDDKDYEKKGDKDYEKKGDKDYEKKADKDYDDKEDDEKDHDDANGDNGAEDDDGVSNDADGDQDTSSETDQSQDSEQDASQDAENEQEQDTEQENETSSDEDELPGFGVGVALVALLAAAMLALRRQN